MISFSSSRRNWVLALVSFTLMVTGLTTSFAAAQTESSRSMEIRHTSIPAQPGTVIISGSGFTPESDIYIALYDQWGVRHHETRWVTGSATLYNQYPGTGIVLGGAFAETFEELCGTTAMVRAYDQATDSWSDWQDIATSEMDCDGP